MISVVLNVYNRSEFLDQQVDFILNQSVGIDPQNIHVWYNQDAPDPSVKGIKTYRCSWNTKFHGRFTVPLLCRTEYVAIFDDDNFPCVDWFKSCLEVINTKETNGILGGTGVVILQKGGKKPYFKYGWNGTLNSQTERVDYVGQSWFFRQEWAKYMWYEKPINWDNGEDIAFSYLAQKYGGINTFVPPHPYSNKDIWSTDYDMAYRIGRDKHASWRLKGHTHARKDLFFEYIRRGWKTRMDVK